MADIAPARRLVYRLEWLGALVAYGFFAALPLRAASSVGGFLARTVGPHVGVTNRARTNLRRAMPALSDAEIERIVRGMWDNLGRIIAEYAHLRERRMFEPGGDVEVAGIIHRLKAQPPPPGDHYIFWSGHYGNWEILPATVIQAGMTTSVLYRAANNPYVDRLIQTLRGGEGRELVPKGAGRRAIAALHRGSQICLLVDQKMNSGAALPFFGRTAMTDIVLARLALRYDCRVVPVRVDRIKGARLRITFEEPMELPRTGDDEADALTLMTRINARLEEWVRDRPEQWFWLHRRWRD